MSHYSPASFLLHLTPTCRSSWFLNTLLMCIFSIHSTAYPYLSSITLFPFLSLSIELHHAPIPPHSVFFFFKSISFPSSLLYSFIIHFPFCFYLSLFSPSSLLPFCSVYSFPIYSSFSIFLLFILISFPYSFL